MLIEEATVEDAAEILALQKLAYQSEAELHDDFDLPPLTQTLPQMEADLQRQLTLKATIEDRIIGSVRAHVQGDTCYIGRLIFHSELQIQGIGTLLMHQIEARFGGIGRYELFTGHHSERNLYLYGKLGYEECRREALSPKVTLVHLEKRGRSDAKMWKRIGILGGISHESTAAYYQRLHARYFELQGDYHYPEVIVYSLDFQRFTDLEEGNDRQAYADYILTGLNALERAGAEFGLLAANSPHAVYGDLEARSPLPLVSIVEVTAREAARLGLGRLLLLGIRFTMEGSFYPEACRRYGLAVVAPDSADRKWINHIIFDELVVGRIEASSRHRLLEIIGQYDVDGVILGCTELPLLLQEGDTAVPLLNTLDLHVGAALDLALGRH